VPITLELLGLLLAIASPLFIGAFALWGRIEKKFSAVDAATVLRVAALKLETDKIESRMADLEKTAVTKEDYQADRDATNRAIGEIGLALRETSATITSRIDLVLFEVGRNRNGKPDN